MGTWMVVGEFALLLEDSVSFFDNSVILEAAAENEVGDYMVERVVGEFEGFNVHDLEVDIAGAHVLGLLPCNVKPAREHVNPNDETPST